MILTYFSAGPAPRPNVIGCGLSQRAYPLECRAPLEFVRVLKRLERRERAK